MDDATSLRLLRYFLALVATGGGGQAAARAGISQPSLSQQIAALERRLGLCLFERGRRGAVPTPEGRALRDSALAVMEALDGLSETAAELPSGISGQLRLGSTPTIKPCLLPGLVRRLHARHPQARLVPRDGDPRTLCDDLMDGRRDVVLTQLPVDVTGVAVTRLFREPLMRAMAHAHPLVRCAGVTGSCFSCAATPSITPKPSPGWPRSRMITTPNNRWSSCPALRATGC